MNPANQSNVVSLSQFKQENSPHWTGQCVCLGCQHTWEGVALVGTTILDCPACNLPKGHAKHLMSVPADGSLFVCNCGSEGLSAIAPKNRPMRLICLACGVDHTGAVFPL